MRPGVGRDTLLLVFLVLSWHSADVCCVSELGPCWLEAASEATLAGYKIGLQRILLTPLFSSMIVKQRNDVFCLG